MRLPARVEAPAPVFSQMPARAEAGDPLLKSCEQAVDELKLRRSQAEALAAENAAKDEQLKLYDQLVARERERGDLYKQAAADRAGANTLDDRRDELRREQIAMYAEENVRLRRENERLRNPPLLVRLFKPDTLTAFAAGYGAKGLQGH